MVHFSPERLDSLLQNARGKKIMVIGDMMVDRYLWGTVTRLSPEAPVPIINIEDEDIRFGKTSGDYGLNPCWRNGI